MRGKKLTLSGRRLGVDDGGFGRIPRGLSFCLRIIFCKKGSIEIHLIFILPLLQQKGGDKWYVYHIVCPFRIVFFFASWTPCGFGRFQQKNYIGQENQSNCVLDWRGGRIEDRSQGVSLIYKVAKSAKQTTEDWSITKQPQNTLIVNNFFSQNIKFDLLVLRDWDFFFDKSGSVCGGLIPNYGGGWGQTCPIMTCSKEYHWPCVTLSPKSTFTFKFQK